MIKRTTVLLALLCATILIGCGEKEEDTSTYEVNQKGSVQMELTTKHLNTDKDLLIITRKIWKDGVAIKTDTIRDTVPSLGNTKEWGENENGEEKEITVPRDYEFFVTVK